MAPTIAAILRHLEGKFSMGSPTPSISSTPASTNTHAIANAGLLLPATLAERLGIEQAADALIDLGERAGVAHPAPGGPTT